MDYPVPNNPFEGKGLTDDLVKEITEASEASWEVDPAWRIGDTGIAALMGTPSGSPGGQKRLRDLWEQTKPDDPNEPYVTWEQLQTIVDVALAFPGPVRDLNRSFFDHYAGWILHNVPEGASRTIEQMRASGEFDSLDSFG